MRSKWLAWKPSSTKKQSSEGFEGTPPPGNPGPGPDALPLTTTWKGGEGGSKKEKKEISSNAYWTNNATNPPSRPLTTHETVALEGEICARAHVEVTFGALVRRWVAEKCVAPVRCSSNPRILNREFSVWAGLAPTDAAPREFLEQLAKLGFSGHDGMVEGLCLATDFVAALR